MNERDTRAAILEAQTLAFVQALDAQAGPPIEGQMEPAVMHSVTAAA